MVWSSTRKLADAIYNDIVSGLRGYHTNMSLSKEQLMQDIIDLRLLIIKEYMIKGILPIQDLLVSLNCIPVDCDYLDKCPCNQSNCGKPTAHFEIPQILFDYGLNKSIKYIGSTDKQNSFLFYTSPLEQVNTFLKYRKRGKNKPWVYIDITPNTRGYLDCYVFGIPLIKQISISAVFKDPRQLEDFQCGCGNTKENLIDTNFNFIDTIIKDRLTQQKIKYYRQLAAPVLPNDQKYNAG